MMIKFQDATELSGVIVTKDGYLTASVKAARTGIQQYAGYELDRPDLSVVNVYRPAASVFSRDSLETFPNIPVTLDHPLVPVTSETYDKESVGNVFEVAREGESIRASIQIMSKRAIDAVNAGKRELSVGYDAELLWGDGVTSDGQAYQAIQTNIRANHLAIVDNARAGSEYRIDSNVNNWGAAPLNHVETKDTAQMVDNLTTVVLGDAAVKVAADDAKALELYKRDMTKALADAESAFKIALGDKDKELAAKDGKISDLESKILSDADIDLRVAAKAKLTADAKAIFKNIVTDGKSDMDIRKEAVTSVRGADAVAGKSDEYITAAFDFIAADSGKPTHDAAAALISGGVNAPLVDSLNDAYHARDEALTNAWKNPLHTGKGA